MPKPSKKPHGPRAPSNGKEAKPQGFAQLQSKIESSLSNSELKKKRKKPPTSASEKPEPKRQRATPGAPSKSLTRKNTKVDKHQEALLAEIKALGGDESDLKLINDVDSDDEVEAPDAKHKIDKRLKDELAALSKDLGFANARLDDDASQDEEQDQDGDQDEQGEQDEQDEQRQEQRVQVAKGNSKNATLGGMIFEPLAEWHAQSLGSLSNSTSDQLAPYKSVVESLREQAQTYLQEDAAKYKTSIFASSSHKFLTTIMSSGTLTDKVSALTLAIQESPVHNTRALDVLMNLASKRSRAQAIGAIGALVDLFGPGTLLPADRRLRTFQTQPGLLGTLQKHSVKTWAPHQPLPGNLTKAHLIAWAYEDWLKETYFKLIQLLEVWCADEIEFSRTKALDFVYALLKEKPEQEANLLTLLINKLGDRDGKISSRASYLLLQLQVSHPGMKPIIIRAIEQDILVHPSQDTRSKYYAINTLNQTILSNKEPGVAESLIRIYFDLFVTLLKGGSLGFSLDQDAGRAKEPSNRESRQDKRTKQPPAKGKAGKPAAPETESADKLISAILTGVNRAAPFVGANDAILETHVDTLFKIAHSANLNTGIQALLLIQHLSSARNLATDRFYRTLYESLLDPRLVTSSKQALYLNLLLRALKSDVDVRRVKAFVKRMLQISNLHQPSFVCGLLYIVSQLWQTFPDLATLVEEPETSAFDDDETLNQGGQYDGRKRDPEHCNAQRSCLWELIPVMAHFHPSVSVYATALLDKERKLHKPDLESHTLIRFLDKFVYKNPKTGDTSRGTSIMQPLRAAKDVGNMWLGSRSATSLVTHVNSAAFWSKKADEVAAQDVFFHQYFQHLPATAAKKKTKQPVGEASAHDSDKSDDDDDEVWKALVSTRPEIAGDGSEDGFDDLDELDMASENDGSSPALSLDSDMGSDDEHDFASDQEADDGLVAVAEADQDEADEGKSKKKSRRRAFKDLPMFASVEDYAELLAQDEDGN
ncbi:hypothetical protein CDD81_5581 [Ophiocordyceps australis]|uniref:CCAAT-binding factor domain-containing protein n=1 Tax=Ophiocordyceps australis TaxID=1399860 RepID=A0A2C5X9Z7_9HYPO|nr:hypothetical protein CDD81_5581 [Ophiocordyceps australis]